MTNKFSMRSWERLLRSLVRPAAGGTQEPSATHSVPLPFAAPGAVSATESIDPHAAAELDRVLRDLHSRISQQDAALFYAKAALAAEIRERQTAELELQRANEELESLNHVLEHSRELLQALFNGLEDGLLLLDHQNTVQVANRALAAMVGVALNELPGRQWSTIRSLLAPQMSPEGEPPTTRPNTTRHRSLRPDGSTRLLDIQSIRLDQVANQRWQSIIHIVDVTESARRQEQIMDNERFAAAGRLAASVAHEINTPLQTVQTSLELMRSLPPGEHEALLNDALDEIQRVGRIVRQLLDLYRPTAEGMVDLAALVERVVLLLGKRIQDQRIEVRRQVASVLPIYGRSDELTQVVINLVVNALDVMPAGGVLTFRATAVGQPPAQLRLEVCDTGPGVPPALCERIFDPFITTKAEGTGLGLAISRQIVERHGGTLELVQPASGGSVFCMHLPVYHHPDVTQQ
jgi:PAS domain S-box-containing protein